MLTEGGFPYPATTDTPDVPRDIEALAEAVDGRLGNLKIMRGTVNVPVNNSATGTAQTVSYAAAGFTAPPSVALQAVGSNVWFAVSPTNPGPSTMSVSVRNADNSAATINIPVHWIVIGPVE